MARRALVVAELDRWGLNAPTRDPGLVLLQLVEQSSRRVAFYSSLLAEQFALVEAGESTTVLPARIAVLVGPTYALSRDGDPVAVGEAIRALVTLEQQERALCASFASKAVAAGLELRMVEQAERVGALITTVLQRMIDDPQLALSVEQKGAVGPALRSALALVPGGPGG